MRRDFVRGSGRGESALTRVKDMWSVRSELEKVSRRARLSFHYV
jgi:hypothetical protein